MRCSPRRTAHEVTAAEEPRLHNVVEGIAIAAGIPKPRVYVVPEQAPNAYATGRNPEHSSIAVTQGLLDTMNRVELEGVIGHEMSHVEDRDILLGTVIATVVGAAVLMSEFFMRSLGGAGWVAGAAGQRSTEQPNALTWFAVGIVLLIIAPLAGQLIKLSVSRNREDRRTRRAATLTRNPPGLSARLETSPTRPTRCARRTTPPRTACWLDSRTVPGP